MKSTHRLASVVGPWSVGAQVCVAILATVGALLAGLSASCAATTPLPDPEDCGDIVSSFGPFDYRTADRSTIKLVEDFHFTPQVERLVHGQTGSIEGDLSYTLRAIPNHHRALLAMANLGIKLQKPKLRDSPYSVTCWFERATRFRPDDGSVRVILGYYLGRTGNPSAGIDQLRQAIEMGAESGNAHYNLGLLLFEVKEYDAAAREAKLAASLGFPLEGLKRKLVAAGKWQD
jgi:tetratricopeptide (TPR) repeat protein